MGQRHQTYIVVKCDNEIEAVAAYHHQWSYGLSAVTRCIRLVELLEKQKYKSCLSDTRFIDTAVKSVYGVDLDGQLNIVHDQTEYLIEDSKIQPDNGDNNDGCTLILIDLDKEIIRAGFFSIHGLEARHCDGQNYTLKSLEEYLACYYNKAELSELNMKKELKILKNHKVKTITKTDFKKIMKKD